MKRKTLLSFFCTLLLSVLCLFMGISCTSAEPVYSISLNKSKMNLAVGGTSTLAATIREDGTPIEAPAEWASSDENVITVDANGKVTGVADGTATVTATYKEVSATCEVTVKAVEVTLTLSETQLALYEGETATLTVTASDGGSYTYEWESSDEAVATVEDGVITAISAGETVVSASYAGITVSCNLTVEVEELFLTLSKTSVNMHVGDEETIVARFIGGSSQPAVTWESSDETVATVENGKITALKSGSTVITAEAGNDLTATCNVTVSDEYELIFPALGDLYINEATDLNIIIKKNGVVDTEGEAIITGDGFTTQGGKITPVQSGAISITVSYAGQIRTQDVNVYQKITTKAELEAVSNDLTGWYRLANDIDMQGGTFNSIAHYTAAANVGFDGVFEGGGHCVMNFIPVYNGVESNNSALFGQIGTKGVVRNLNVINVKLTKAITGGLVTINRGTVENCFVNVTIAHAEGTSSNRQNNPTGGVVSKNYGTIKNVVSVVTLDSSLTSDKLVSVGAFVGRSYASSTIENCYSISSSAIGFYESATPTNDGNNAMLGTQTNTKDYDSLDAFYGEVSALEGWTFEEGYYPHIGEIDAKITLNATSATVYANAEYTIVATCNFPVGFELKESYDDVTVDANGLVKLGANVEKGQEIVVIVKSLYNSAENKEVTLTVGVDSYAFEIAKTAYEFDWYVGESTGNTETLSYTFTKNGAACSETLTWTATDSTVAKVEGNVLTAIGDGTTTINVSVGAANLATITVTSNMWNKVSTNAEFLAIGTDKTTMAKKYKLAADLDFAGEAITAFSSYNIQKNLGISFTGIFDGDGHSISNFEPMYNTKAVSSDRDRSIFGYLEGGAIVRNVAFYGVKSTDRTSVVSSWLDGNSIVENIYCELDLSASGGINVNDNNPGGTIVAKVRPGSTVRNCVVVLTIAEKKCEEMTKNGVICLSAFVGINEGTVQNCQTIYAPRTGEELNFAYKTTGTITDSAIYASAAKFFEANADANYDANVWAFDEAKGTIGLK